MIPNLADHIRNWVEFVGLLLLIAANGAKIISMERNTRRWNGLGKAMRVEKWTYVALFSWLLLMPHIPVLDHGLVLIGLVAAVVWAEVHVIRMVPIVRIRHDGEEPTV